MAWLVAYLTKYIVSHFPDTYFPPSLLLGGVDGSLALRVGKLQSAIVAAVILSHCPFYILPRGYEDLISVPYQQ